MAWLRLIRWPNLLIIALTQAVAWLCVIYPMPGRHVLDPFNFLLLSLSTVLIAAGGYIINDYFDIDIDAINKPEKVILERDIPRRLAIIVHSALNIIALALAGIVAFSAGHPEWLVLQLFCTFMLWRYSTTWKRQFAIGNIVVALMTALTIVALIIYEPALRQWTATTPGEHLAKQRWILDTPDPGVVLIVFALFAFMLTWMREIVKDMEDYKGDDAEGCITMPIQWGLLKSSRFVQGLGLIVLVVLGGTTSMLWLIGNIISAIFVLLAVVIPLSLWIINLTKAATSEHYHSASTRIKWIMVFGVASLFVLHLTDNV
jgi:4-hydroxybenzoate polyprenyltransferase